MGDDSGETRTEAVEAYVYQMSRYTMDQVPSTSKREPDN